MSVGALSTAALRELLDNDELVEAVAEPCACGAPRVLSLGVDSVICSDKNCPFRVASRIFAIVSKYGCSRDITLGELEHICQERFYRTWLDFFADDWEESEFEDVHRRLVDALKADYDIPLMLSFSGFDAISLDQLYNLCGGFINAAAFSQTLDTDGVMMVTERLGLNEAHLLPAAIHIFNEITACLSDIFEADELFGGA